MNRAEELFTAEAKLRYAATDYAEWAKATNRTADILNARRKALRDAAVAYAAIARSLEEPLK